MRVYFNYEGLVGEGTVVAETERSYAIDVDTPISGRVGSRHDCGGCLPDLTGWWVPKYKVVEQGIDPEDLLG